MSPLTFEGGVSKASFMVGFNPLDSECCQGWDSPFCPWLSYAQLWHFREDREEPPGSCCSVTHGLGKPRTGLVAHEDTNFSVIPDHLD